MISIVMAYYNRRAQLVKTLESIRYFGNPEIIVVDDASTEHIGDIEGIKVIRIEPEEKHWINGGAVQFNIGFSHATGDIIIMQNPECIHVGNILDYALEIKEREVLSFAAYSLDYHLEYDYYDPQALKTHIMNEPQRIQIAHHGWYNHSKHRPEGFHFCNVIRREDLQTLGGFDERFAGGIGFDDNDLVRRIKKAGFDLRIIDNPFVIHQKHERTNYQSVWTKRMLNEGLYNSTANCAVKPPMNKYYGC